MRRFWIALLACMLLTSCAISLAEDAAMVEQETDLLDAPGSGADVLMTYYIGTTVRIVREMNEAYVEVIVGEGSGSLTGYMRTSELALGERETRMVHPDVAQFYANAQPCVLYSAPDTACEVIAAEFYVEDAAALGYKSGEWLHMQDDYGRMGFVNLRELTITREEHHTPYTVEVQPMEGELSIDTAIEEAKARILADHETGANLNMGMDNVTAEGLEACPVEAKVYAYNGIGDRLFYQIDFIDPQTGNYYAWIVLEVKGTQVLGYSYGNG